MKKFLSIILSILMIVTMIPVSALSVSAATENITVTIDTGASVTLKDTDGDDYYEIGTADELYAFSAAVNSGKNTINGELTSAAVFVAQPWVTSLLVCLAILVVCVLVYYVRKVIKRR